MHLSIPLLIDIWVFPIFAFTNSAAINILVYVSRCTYQHVVCGPEPVHELFVISPRWDKYRNGGYLEALIVIGFCYNIQAQNQPTHLI